MSISLQGTIGRGEFERSLSFSVADGEVLAITGPNGSGKSTIIYTIAGLVPLRSGQLQSDNVTWDAPDSKQWVAPENRTCAVVFQDLRLFPHMNVIANVAYGLRAHGVNKDEAHSRSTSVLARVGLSSLNRAYCSLMNRCLQLMLPLVPPCANYCQRSWAVSPAPQFWSPTTRTT